MTGSRHPKSKEVNHGDYYTRLMSVAACQLNILNIYDPKGRDERELRYDTATSEDIEGKIDNGYTSNIISLIREFDEDIDMNQEVTNPDLEKWNQKLKDQLNSLKKLKKNIESLF